MQRARFLHHHVVKKRSQKEAESHLAVVAEHLKQLVRELPKRDVGMRVVNKLALKDEQTRFLDIDFRECG